MTYAVTVLAAACCVLGFLLVCALVGGSDQRDQLQAKVDRLQAQVEGLEADLRRRSMGNHPAGRALRAAPTYHEAVAEWDALREVLTERDAEHEGGGDE